MWMYSCVRSVVQKTHEPAPWWSWMEMENSRCADVGVGRGFVELGSAAAVAADGQLAEIDVEAVGIDLRRRSSRWRRPDGPSWDRSRPRRS